MVFSSDAAWCLRRQATDYQVSDEIIREMQSVSPAADTNGYNASSI
jgi:hypothetical protein